MMRLCWAAIISIVDRSSVDISRKAIIINTLSPFRSLRLRLVVGGKKLKVSLRGFIVASREFITFGRSLIARLESMEFVHNNSL